MRIFKRMFVIGDVSRFNKGKANQGQCNLSRRLVDYRVKLWTVVGMPVSWTLMIGGYAQNGWGEDAIELFRQMQGEGVNQDPITFSTVLSACSSLGNLDYGKLIHGHIIQVGYK